MAANFQAALLDQLMGVDRNNLRKEEIKWDNDRVCKYYLAGFCPHELFVNTRLSLGPCTKIHEINFLKKYQSSSSYLKVGYERKLQRVLEGFVKDVKIKIKSNEEKLVGNGKLKIELKLESRLEEQQKEIDSLVSKIEVLGNEGKIEECQTIYAELEEKQKQYNYDKIELERLVADSSFNKDVVCQVCGAFTNKMDLNMNDENHINGKTHSGYDKINEVLEKLSNLLDKEKDAIIADSQKDNRDRDKSYSRHRSRESYEYKKIDRGNDYNERRHKHKKEKSKKFSKRRERSRSRERSRNYRNY